MSQYKLVYFNERARAEVIRLVLIYARVPFEDTRLSYEEFGKLKDSGFKYSAIASESREIQLFRMAKFLFQNLMAKCSARLELYYATWLVNMDSMGKMRQRSVYQSQHQECLFFKIKAARLDELYGIYYDRFAEQLPYMLHKIGKPGFEDGVSLRIDLSEYCYGLPQKKIYKESFFPSAKRTLEYYLSLINNSSYFLPSGPSYADFLISDHLETLFEWSPELKVMMPRFTQVYLDIQGEYSKLEEYKQKVYSLESVTDYIKNRKHMICQTLMHIKQLLISYEAFPSHT